MPEATQPITTTPAVPVESSPNNSKAMDTPQNNLTLPGDAAEHMPPPDWDAIAKEGKDLSKEFSGQLDAPQYQPTSVREQLDKEKAKENEQRVETDEEGEKEGEDKKVQGEEQGNESQGTESERNERGQFVEKDKPATEQVQQAQVDPLAERFPEAATFMKKMDKTAREWASARLREQIKLESSLSETKKALTMAAQGKRQIPDSYYDNQHGYVLLPEYHEAVSNENLAAAVEQHWQQQRINLINGEDWQDAQIVVDPQTKQYVLQPGAAQKYSKHGFAFVENALSHANRQYAKMAATKEQIEGGFRQEAQARASRIAEVTDTFFPPDRWGKEGTQETKIMSAVEEDIKGIGITPANPAFGVLVRTTAALMMERNWREQQQRKTQKVASVAEDTRKAGPTGSSTSSGGGKAASAKSVEEEWVKPFQGFGDGSRF